MHLSRQQRIKKLTETNDWDLIIVGGGITGAGVFKLASQVGLNALLLEQKDFAWGSSSRSSKMVHGGLRYIAEGQIKLTKESVEERQHLLNGSHGLVKKQSFALSHYANKFPMPWIFNFLLSIYDLFAGKKQHRYWEKKDYQYLAPGIKSENSLGGTQFVDAMTDDARLVLRLIQGAQELGSLAINYVGVTKLINDNGKIVGVEVKAEELDIPIKLKAKCVINATGAWANELINKNNNENDKNIENINKKINSIKLRPLRGSHLIVASWRLPVASAISVPHPEDQRPVQIFPWQNVTVIGTTDVEHDEPLSLEPKISQSELDYLLACVDHQFPDAKLKSQDIISTFAGVRPVIANSDFISKKLKPSQEKREHSIWKSSGLINIAGGKLTTFRVIAKEVLELLSKEHEFSDKLKNKKLDRAIFDALPELLNKHTENYVNDLVMAKYGGLCNEFIEQSQTSELSFIGYTENLWAELVWAVKHEQVMHLDDLLLRRTRIGNILPDGAMDEIDKIKKLCSSYFPWSESQWLMEINRYKKIWETCYSLPETSKNK